MANKTVAAKTAAAKTTSPKTMAPKTMVAAKKKSPAKKKRNGYSTGDFVVYPTHGVGRITGIEKQEIAGFNLELFVISFDSEKMTLRVPVKKADEAGLRALSSHQHMNKALITLRGRSRISRAMWSRRAQEYEAKISSGDPISIAEVVRDLHRNASQPDQSYSERQIYEAARMRLSRELAAVESIDQEAASVRIDESLQVS